MMDVEDSIRLELMAEKHNHKKDNEYLWARANNAEAACREVIAILEPMEGISRLYRGPISEALDAARRGVQDEAVYSERSFRDASE